jgi:hypothetical protein
MMKHGIEGVGRTQMIEDMVQWWALVNTVMNFPVCVKGWKFLDLLSEYEAQDGFYVMEPDA